VHRGEVARSRTCTLSTESRHIGSRKISASNAGKGADLVVGRGRCPLQRRAVGVDFGYFAVVGVVGLAGDGAVQVGRQRCATTICLPGTSRGPCVP
jgi:hypothetical protein